MVMASMKSRTGFRQCAELFDALPGNDISYSVLTFLAGIDRFTAGDEREQQSEGGRFLIAEQESAALGFGEAAGQGEADAVTRAEGALAER
jgi:hypothetical protein